MSQVLASFKNLSTVTQIYLWGYLIISLFGFIGNIASLLTFSGTTLRNISIGCLFIVWAISDTIHLLISIIDFVEFGLKSDIFLYRIQMVIVLFTHRFKFTKKVAYDALYHFRSFIFYVTQLNSA